MELYTVTEVSKLLKVNKNAVYDLIRNGYLKALKYGVVKIPSTEVDRFIEKWTGYDLSDLKNPKLITY